MFLLATEEVIRVFCSGECRSRWFDVCGMSSREFADASYADDVDPQVLNV